MRLWPGPPLSPQYFQGSSHLPDTYKLWIQGQARSSCHENPIQVLLALIFFFFLNEMPAIPETLDKVPLAPQLGMGWAGGWET